MKPKLLILFFIQIALIVNMSFAQTLKDEMQNQKKLEEIEKMRKEDEKTLAEIEKAKNSVPRDVLANKGYQISCEGRVFGPSGTSDADKYLYSDVSMYITKLVIFDKSLYSIQSCSKNDKTNKYCSFKIASLKVDENIIEFNESNNKQEDLKRYSFSNFDISDWQFDLKSKKLFVKIKKKIIEISPCYTEKWTDGSSY